MNSLLADLKREREERERKAAANAGGCPETGEGAASGKVQEADSSSVQGVSGGSSRKRKQSVPQRIIRDPAQVAQGSSATERAVSQEVGGEKDGGSSKSEKVKDPSKKRSGPSQPASTSQGTFTGDFDAEHMAACIVSGTIFSGRESRGEVSMIVSLCAC